MHSTIANAAIRRAPVFLLEIDAGETIRLATADVCLADRRFAGMLLDVGAVGASFDWQNFAYSPARVAITAANVRMPNGLRLTDRETFRIMDRAKCRLYVWFPGLSWSDVETRGLIAHGVFRKDPHSIFGQTLDFSIEPDAGSVWGPMSSETINDTTWPDHRKAGGGGAVTGVRYPRVFGAHDGGLYLHCVDTTVNSYLVASGFIDDVDEIRDSTGAGVSSGSWSQSWALDGSGNAVTLVGFASDMSSLEPLTAAASGVVDYHGTVVANTGDLVQHPTDILRYMINTRTSVGPLWADVESIKTARELFAGIGLAATCTAEADAGAWLDRLLYQCCLARTDRVGGRHGIVALDLAAPATTTISARRHTVGDMSIRKTPWDMVVNWATADYGYQASSGTYAGSVVADRTNHAGCASSFLEYGAVGHTSFQFPDAPDEGTAIWMLDRRFGFFSHRHDLVDGVSLPYSRGWDLRRGDCVALTIPEGQSRDGEGWFDEPCLIVEKYFRTHDIQLTLMRV